MEPQLNNSLYSHMLVIRGRTVDLIANNIFYRIFANSGMGLRNNQRSQV